MKIIFLSLLLSSSTLFSEEILVNRILANVNDHPITAQEVQMLLQPIQIELMKQYHPQSKEYQKQLENSRKRIIEELINNELIIQEFSKRGGEIPEHIIDQEIKKQIRQIHGDNFESFYRQLEKEGISRQQFRENMKRRFIVSIAQSTLARSVSNPTITQKTLKEQYAIHKTKLRNREKDTIRYRRIFIPKEKPSKAKEEKETKQITTNENEENQIIEPKPIPPLSPEEILEKLKENPEKFNELAKQYSSDAFAEKGGEWPLTKRFDLNLKFSNLLFEAPLHQIIGPIKEFKGTSIIQVLEKNITPPPPLNEETSQKLKALINREKLAKAREEWIQEMRSKAFIRYPSEK